jgi:hypothetical protein
MGVFVLSALLRDIRAGTIFKGVAPFWMADIVRRMLILPQQL